MRIYISDPGTGILSGQWGEADQRPPQAGNQKEGMRKAALFLVPVTGLDAAARH